MEAGHEVSTRSWNGENGDVSTAAVGAILPDNDLGEHPGQGDAGSRAFLPFRKVLSLGFDLLSRSDLFVFDYSKRHPKRILIPKTKASSTPRGFAPIARPLVGTSTQKRDQNDTEDKEPSHTPSSTLTDKIFTRDSQAADKNFSGIPFTATIDTECDVPIVRSGNEEHGQGLGTQYVKVDHSDKIIENGEKIGQFNEVERHVALGNDQIGGISISEKTSIADQQEEKPSNRENNSGKDDTDSGDSLLKHREEFDALKQRKQLEDLANENFSRGNKIFVTPEVVTQDQVIKVFLNQNLSVLATETEILIKGAYNGWKWKFFTEKLQKTNLIGDWWACELYVPKEAYRVDFVFFNGADVYENNDYKDFSISVEGDMDETKFEEFLLEEKKKELERLAAEENEKKRLAEEQRQREAEKAAIESDRLQAKTQVEKRRQGLHHVMKLASQSAHHVWQMEPSLFEGGDRIKLYYNRSSRPLAHASEIWVHGGHNNWSEGLSIVRELSRSEKVDGDWWCVDVVVPDQAVVLDWVFANGPPGKAVCYDNNNLNDFHATVSKGMPDELFWVEEEQRIFRKLQEDRRKKAEKIERVKAETKERTMKMFLLSHKHIVYTEPVDVQAGKMVSIFYNPSNTVLNGKPEVWFRSSFSVHLMECDYYADVKVPIDAYMMDFVFSEKEDGGLYDNRNKMDYHIPVTGSITKEPPMHIIHISVEMAPIAKVGGLGDVVTSLSRAVQDLGHKVDVILPNYNCERLPLPQHLFLGWGRNKSYVRQVETSSYFFPFGGGVMGELGNWLASNIISNIGEVSYHSAYTFGLDGLEQAGYESELLNGCSRWGAYMVEMMMGTDSVSFVMLPWSFFFKVDFNLAPVAWLFKEHYIHNGLSNSQVVFTIHNLEFGIQNIARAMMFADKATTVSQTYSREISGNSAISPHLDKFHGIVNGIDPDIWDPCNDQFIPVSYTSENVMEGKRAAKDALQQRLGLKRSDLPLVGIITRLTVQKGIHLIKHAVVLLGSAPDPRIQNDFVNLGNQLHNSHADRARFCLTYDEPLSHLIYAGADFILVPSIFEPCGLTQLIAMRYGSVPIVRKTGGLYDTVFDVDNDKERAQAQGLEPNGFSFEGTDAGAMDSALNRHIKQLTSKLFDLIMGFSRAFPAWSNAREWFYSLCKRVMEQDWRSWNGENGDVSTAAVGAILPDNDLGEHPGQGDAGSRAFLPFRKVLSLGFDLLSRSDLFVFDYSKRHPKRILIPKTKASSTPRGFAPIARPLVGTSTQKRDQNDTEDKEPSHTPSSTLTDKIFTRDSQAADKNFSGIPFTATIDTECDVPIVRSGNEEHGQGLGTQYVKVDHSDKIIENGEKIGQFNEVERHVALGNDQIGGISISEKTSIADQQEEKPSNRENNSGKDDTDSGDSLLKHREEFDALKQRKQLEDLANENFSRGNKIFVTPEVVTQDQVIKVFLNQNLSVLATETEILIKGAYNGWKWKFFTEKLQKTNLIGDWWACELYVPKEAYRVDFVFFNGADVYENNDYKDFSISVEGDMDETKFEEFLLEEKKKELERLAAEENEKKRLAEEQRQREAEKAAIESDRLQAKTQVEKRRQGLHHVMKLASQSAHHVWQMEPSLFEGGDRIKLYYNRSSRPLAHASEIWVHGGHNNWSEGLSIVRELSRSEKVDGDWWCVDVVVPDQAVVLDWVFANGPPGKAVCYDNNNLNDFHATVSKGMPDELFWVEEEQRIFRKLQEDRRKKAEKIERVKAETKERTMKMFLLSHKHIVYTEPVDVQAGKMVSIFYNPSNTVLNGKPEVWFRSSFSVHLMECDYYADVKVPIDAYMMDFVFSEKEDGGLYDNRNKMDYHIPVTGSITKEPPMHIIHISVEMAPIAKVGGLGDVVTSLSRAVQDLGHKVDVILPNYNCERLPLPQHLFLGWGRNKSYVRQVETSSYFFPFGGGVMGELGNWLASNIISNIGEVSYHSAYTFGLDGLEQAGYESELLNGCSRWGAYMVEMMMGTDSVSFVMLPWSFFFKVDFNLAPVAWLFKEHYIHNGLSNSQVVFTIHNLEFGIQNIARAMMFADKATTVSQTYSREISGNSAISPHLDKFHGIVNGIDPDIWDPCNDQFIPVSYTSENVMEGKRAAKDALQQRLGLKRSDLPLVGIITRLTVQKGIHLIKHAVVLLGSAPDPRIQNDFVNLGNQLHNSHADRARFCLTYDEPLSHLIYAGADFILVPSIFEPCGLTQLIAMRYGSVPIVRKTGGLYDTVFDVDNDKERAQAQGLEPNGFSFEGTDAGAMDSALNRHIKQLTSKLFDLIMGFSRAFPAWSNAREWFYSLCKRVMEQDWSWNRPALDYMELYHSTRS
ncbi:hypothetical protein ZIOFF_030698 [Zingiber officinale]|uniref:starch synthase n=1 Tax=Zingiber officinale TaxID=94328 RepID=A0A8J5GVV5_ZINOF|nr:hypothetical protein ZIOFF_030698 [Zingiber officinale]